MHPILLLAACVPTIMFSCGYAKQPGAHRTSVPRAASVEYEFAFQASDSAVGDSRSVEDADGSCGFTPTVRVKVMPLSDSKLHPEIVIEMNSHGRETARWGKPTETKVLGIRGDRLYFQAYDHEKSFDYWTDKSGKIGRINDSKLQPISSNRTCPCLPEMQSGGHRVVCATLTDFASSTKRSIGWQDSCYP